MNKKKVLGKNVKTPKTPIGFDFDRIKNINIRTNFNIRITVPEFTSICPITNQPDFALFIIDYIPKNWIVESKSFKLFIHAFRNYGVFHEDATLLIGKSLYKSLSPKWLRIAGYFAPRGGIPIDIFWQSGKCLKDVYIPDLTANIYKFNRA